MRRIFDNPQNLTSDVIHNRLVSLDFNNVATVYDYVNDIGTVIHYVAIDSFLTDTQIGNSLLTPTTAAEITENTRRATSLSEAALAIELKTVTPAEAVAWIDLNVTSLATAKTVLKIMVRMLIALRNLVMSTLPEN